MATQTASSGLGSVTARQWLILLMVQLCTLLFGMTITLANVVLPQIKGAMSATQDQIAWVITFNLIATAIGTPLVGWLASRLGWRTVMFGSALGFTISSFLCAFATSLETLVLFRVGQGLFGAPIMPMGQAIVLATFPRHQHAMMMMIWGIGAVIGPVAGPVIGSFVSELYGWRMAFLMIVPPGILATLCCWFALSEHTSRNPTHFDWTGFIALSVAIAAAQAVLDTILEENLMDNAIEVGGEILDGLRDLQTKYDVVGDVRGAGLYFAVELVKDRESKVPDMDRALAAVNALRDQRILISATGADAHILKIRPPLVFTSANAGRLLEGIDNALRAVQY